MIKPELLDRIKDITAGLDIERLKKEGLISLNEQFFPSVHYPPITMYPNISEDALFDGYQNPADGFFDIYLHIPFCIKYCSFCHYPVLIGDLAVEKDRYLEAIAQEMDIYLARLGLKKIKARSVLVGGGTPTYLSLEQLRRFLDSFCGRVDLSSCRQFSYDVDPITISGQTGQARLKIMREHGVDRLTIGIQSLDDGLLKIMNRQHNAGQAIESIREAKAAGFKLNIEFIYGYPGQSLECWASTLDEAVKTGADEIQIYRLKVIPYGDHTGCITRKFGVKPEDFLSLEKIIQMKALAMEFLPQAGYHENLARVFSRTKDDFSCYADDQCCNLFDQLGFGLTAFSSLRDRFGLNTQDFEEYYSRIGRGRLPVNRGLVRDRDNQLRWAIVLPLKNRKVFKEYFKKITGVSLNDVFRKKIDNLKDFGLLFEDDKILMLTEKGRFFADEVCHQFHHPDYMPFPKSAYNPGKLSPYADEI